MKLIKVFLFIVLINSILFAKGEKININFKDLKIMDLVKITSKIIDKNILVTQEVKGKVDFISNKPVDKEELIKILIYVLESKGYTLVTNENMLRIVKLNESAKQNVPVVTKKFKENYNQMVTEVFKVYNSDVDYIASKVRHLISKNAKLVTNKNANTIVITDFMENIKTVKTVVSIMTVGVQKKMEVITLQNIQASDAKKNLTEIAKSVFNPKIETEKVSVVTNKENNSIVLIGSAKNTKYLKNYISKIDSEESLVKRVVEVYPLKNVEASNVIKIIDGIIGKKKYIDQNDKPLSSVDEETNSIVLMGPSHEIEYIKILLSQLDKEKAQVYVKARIIELNDERVNEIGIKYGIFGGEAGKDGLGTFASTLNGGSSVLPIPSNFSLNIPNISSGLALGATISLLDQDQALDIVSEPSILAINNKESSIYVGETISVKTSSSVSDGGTTNENFQREDVGLTLKVKPRISNDNKVTLDINTIIEDVKTTQTNSGNADTSKKEVKTMAIVNNGESVIIGGLIQDKEEATQSKIPGLGDIPIIGNLFNHDNKNLTKKSLVVIVTPYIIPKSKDLSFVRDQLAELKILEAKFLKDALVRLKEKQVNEKKEKLEYDKKLKDLDRQLSRLKNDDSVDENKKQLTDEERHKLRLKKYFGI